MYPAVSQHPNQPLPPWPVARQPVAVSIAVAVIWSSLVSSSRSFPAASSSRSGSTSIWSGPASSPGQDRRAGRLGEADQSGVSSGYGTPTATGWP